MAVTYRSVSTADSNNATVLSLTISTPTGAVAGDLLVAAVSVRGAQYPNTPSGWTLAAQVTAQNDSGRSSLFYRKRVAGDPTTVTFTQSNVSGIEMSARMLCYIGGSSVANRGTFTNFNSGDLAVQGTVPSTQTVVLACFVPGSNSVFHALGAPENTGFNERSDGGNAPATMVGDKVCADGIFDNTIVQATSGGTQILTVQSAILASIVENQGPLASPWVAPADNSANDVAATLLLDWTFSDPDIGDTQVSYVLERKVNGAAAQFYNAGTAAWAAGVTINASSTSAVTLAAGWAANAASTVYRVKTYDQLNTEGVFSANLTVIGSTKVNPTLTAPVHNSTITTSQVTATWTVAEQSAYRIRILSATDVEVSTTGKVTSTSVRSVTLPTILENSTTYKVQLTTYNTAGLESNAATNTFSVAFVAPATPTLVVTPNPTTGSITVAITNPPPTGGQPTVTSVDVYVRVAVTARPDGERPSGGDGIRIAAGVTGSSYLDYAAASTVNYQYRVNVKASNGTSTMSVWTG